MAARFRTILVFGSGLLALGVVAVLLLFPASRDVLFSVIRGKSTLIFIILAAVLGRIAFLVFNLGDLRRMRRQRKQFSPPVHRFNYMKRTVMLVAAGSFLLAGVLFFLTTVPRAAPDPSTGSSGLEISKHTDRVIAGAFERQTTKVLFRSYFESNRVVEARIEVVGGLTFDALAELDESGQKVRVIWDGHGQAVATAEVRNTLGALSDALERYLEIPPAYAHEDLLRRTMLYLSEAPVGHPLRKLDLLR